MRPWQALVFVATLLTLPSAQAVDPITLYSCVDAKGKMTLRDTPCAKGEQQQAHAFQRPVDPPPRPVAPPAPAPRAPTPVPEVRYVVVNAPAPLYECVTPDGDRYTSDNASGNPRWVPLWTLGYPWPRHRGFSGASAGLRPVVPPHPPSLPPPTHPHPLPPAFPVAGTVITDQCQRLSQEAVCERLDNRRWEIKRRYLNAMPSERAVLDEEERGLLTRLRQECGKD